MVVACAASKDEPPPDIPYVVQFPSVAAAAAVDGVKIFVYGGDETCLSLIEKRITNQPLPSTIAESPVSTPCDLQGAKGSGLLLPFGHYAVLAVAELQGSDILAGCAIQDIDGKTQLLEIPLTPIDNQKVLPATKCATLSDKCSSRC